MTTWEALTPEQRDKYLERDKKNRKAKSQAKRDEEMRRNMLGNFLRAKTAEEKRAVIESFAPHYFVFGNTLNPNNPYEENDDAL